MKKPHSEVQIRRAGCSDAASISALLHQAFLEYRPLYTDGGFTATAISSEQVENRIREGPVWIALNAVAILGTGSAIPKDESLYIRGMAVHPAVRSSGIGKLLLRTIEEFALASGCKKLLLTTTPFLTAAIRLYEGFGFERTTDGPHDLFGTPLFAMTKTLDRSGA
jgi:GNAT superfamily N-acetyltransferase